MMPQAVLAVLVTFLSAVPILAQMGSSFTPSHVSITLPARSASALSCDDETSACQLARLCERLRGDLTGGVHPFCRYAIARDYSLGMVFGDPFMDKLSATVDLATFEDVLDGGRVKRTSEWEACILNGIEQLCLIHITRNGSFGNEVPTGIFVEVRHHVLICRQYRDQSGYHGCAEWAWMPEYITPQRGRRVDTGDGSWGWLASRRDAVWDYNFRAYFRPDEAAAAVSTLFDCIRDGEKREGVNADFHDNKYFQQPEGRRDNGETRWFHDEWCPAPAGRWGEDGVTYREHLANH